MPQKISTIIAEIFSNGAPQQPVKFSWRSISRKGRPFLLLPETGLDVRMGLELYSAQRRRAKIARALLPAFFKSPAKIWFERVLVEADAATELMEFLAQHSGVPAGRLKTPALRFGGVSENSRITLLLGDETSRPIKVIKIGINPDGRATVDREADLLEKLPPDKLGCIRQTGRLSTTNLSAFAADYFPGASPMDDAGLEHLFHSWLDAGPPRPIETLPTWQEMADAVAAAEPAAWQALQTALAGKKFRTTLFHGDFAPWNIRAINAKNLQVFDWERGHLQGIPGWDWFHFTVQTSILARRLSVERAAAEVEQLINSPRFKNYAAAAGVSDFVPPLLLACLLHQKCVVKPLEGGAATAKLYEFLSAHWRMKSSPATEIISRPAEKFIPAGIWAAARSQLQAAAVQSMNLFWEPSLNFRDRPPLLEKIRVHWRDMLLALLLLAALAATQYFASVSLTFLPLYLAVCALATWKTDRRLGTLTAAVAAAASPLVVGIKDAGYAHMGIFLWNTAMRFIILEMGVLFTNRIREQKNIFRHRADAVLPPPKIADTWAVLLAAGLLFAAIAGLDWINDPHKTFLPLYLFPCMILTLVLNLRWGIAATLAATAVNESIQYHTDTHYFGPETFGWNFVMRFMLFLLVIVLLDRIRRENILFSARK